MKRQNQNVRVNVDHGMVELLIDDEFIANWAIPEKGDIPKAAVNSIAQSAYDAGYKAARADLGDWVLGK